MNGLMKISMIALLAVAVVGRRATAQWQFTQPDRAIENAKAAGDAAGTLGVKFKA
jgi:hypothetical protein